MTNQVTLPDRLTRLDFSQSLLHSDPQSTVTMHPLVIDERLISCFKYWSGSVQQGMQYNKGLYRLLHTYGTHERLQAYAAAYDYAEKGEMICITVSKTSYRLWVGLRSSANE